jgi:predicted transglutaminase-like cysteine proteinase
LAEIPARIVAVALLGLLSVVGGAGADDQEPFGLPTVAAPESPLSPIWRQLQSRIQADQAVVDRCRSERDICASAAARRLIEIVDEARQHEGLARLGHLNRAVNLAIQPTNSGIWRSPLDALESTGDCKSYAVVKYAALGDLGVGLDDRRLVIVHIQSLQVAHVVVAVRFETRWLILDNHSMAIVEGSELHDYRPVLVLDQHGVGAYTPVLSQTVASLPCHGHLG